MESSKLTDTMLTNMEEQATSLARVIKVIKGLKFDKCYRPEHAVNDLWSFVEESMLLEFRRHYRQAEFSLPEPEAYR